MAFITLRQANVVASPGATIKGSPLTNAEVDNNFANINLVIGFRESLETDQKDNVVASINEVYSDVGNVSLLSTSVTDNLVSAINEVDSIATSVDANVGSISALTTTATNNTVAAINEVSAATASIIPFAIALG